MMDAYLIGTIRALRNLLIEARDATPDGAERDKLNAAIGALNALLPERWRVY